MFTRVSTYKTEPDRIDKPADDVAERVLAVPGCLGIYYMNGKSSGKALSITLWETEDAMTQSKRRQTRSARKPAPRKRRKSLKWRSSKSPRTP